MPIYEYECHKCGSAVEQVVVNGTKPPKCCRKTMKRVISYRGMPVFKGPDFYATEHGAQKHNKIPEID